MKIILFGKNGQVGHELQRTLLPLGELIAPARSEVGFEDLTNLEKILYSHAPDVIVNAAAYTAVDQAETEEALAYRINAEAVEVLANYARYNGALLVHYSTDYVFDGEKTSAYIETDVTAPLNVYGKSKRAGEQVVEQGGCHFLLFRTSWVYSYHGSNFIKTILRLAREREHLHVVADQIGSPTSAELIADVTALSIAAYHADIFPEGIHHLAASDAVSRYDLARYIVEVAKTKGAQLKLDVQHIYPSTTEETPSPAKRPKNSQLDNQALGALLGFSLPHWALHVNRVIDQLLQAAKQEH